MQTLENSNDKTVETFSDAVTGRFNAIKQYVEATQNKKGSLNDVKKRLIKKAIKK